MIYDNEKVVECIRDFIKVKRKEKNIVNMVLREEVFRLLERESIVLYYPLPEDRIKGIHVEKTVGNVLKQFVYINSSKEIDNQTWTAAHELGHVWKVDLYVQRKVQNCDVKSEDIVNRFASELLFPLKAFEDELSNYLSAKEIEGPMTKKEFMSVITYLMNYFCAPYKAVIKRLIEIGVVDKQYEDEYIIAFRDNEDLYKQILDENFYTNLCKTTNSISMESVGQDIDWLEKNGIISEKMIRKYRELFHLEKEKETSETFLLGGQDGE